MIALSLADLAGERADRLPGVRRRALQRWLPLSLLLAAMFAFRWHYYGAWLPNPYWAKGADEWHLAAGFAYLLGFLSSAWQVVPLAGLAVFGAWSARSWRLRRVCLYSLLCAGGYALYTAKVGGDFMQYRFAWPPYLVLSAGGLAGLSELARRQVRPAALLGVAVGGLALLPPVLEHRDLVWGLARGNSEVEVAKGEAPLELVEPARAKPNHKPGFAPEWYEPGEEGFYVRRD